MVKALQGQIWGILARRNTASDTYQNLGRASTTITGCIRRGGSCLIEKIGSDRAGRNALGLFAGSLLRQMDGKRLTGGLFVEVRKRGFVGFTRYFLVLPQKVFQ